jgi:hypothetical protein
MGQQQLLLLVLGALIVGLGVYGGTRMMATANQENERDVILQQLNVLVTEARKYAARPATMGGGEGNLIGFTPPQKMTTTDRLTINVTSGANWVLFQAFGAVEGIDGTNPVQVVAQYDFMSDFTSGSWTAMESVN